MRTKTKCVIAKQLFIALLVLISFQSFADQKEIVFGVVPQQSASKLAKQWGPLLEAWSDVTGIKFRFATARDIPTFEERLAAGEYDMAYMNPYHFTLVNHAAGYTALAHAKDKRITGIMVAQKDWNGAIDSLNDQLLAFPAPRAFAASILTQSELRQKGVVITPKYVGAHDSVYMAVAKGLYPAGGGVMRTFNSIPESLREQLKIIYKTNSYTPHAIAYLNSLDTETAEQLRSSIDPLNQHPKAKAMFDMLSIKGFESAKDSDWDDIVGLGINL
ncbi:phosphate ABC transporter substrate-binding protein [Photobacterium swingsii]|uniref:Phosphate ABC transporter substrate-binding protein n=1 Tax=Photobacterium swingsii TaxID=680026 RepID=A0A0J8VBV4_9GAMM|nr:phosphate/phosphite/phosphonate ABC transporter substrate-binding protein [Photobacterium swingsii]KMV30978.1 phosphate ABC transporter substrate-binding protein [Photobacterium swingsii]PSW23461.1 phosphate ABC transporter substrate-binding protein [Photobacterium swingsii]